MECLTTVDSCATIAGMKHDFLSLLTERGIRRIDLAKKLNVHKSLVTRWVKGRVPAERVLEVERVTGIPRERIRPDIFGQISEDAA